VVAPFFIKGDIEFGVITQSAMAFAQLMGAFSLIVTQFQSISSYAAVIGRLGKMVEAMDHPCGPENSKIEVQFIDNRIVFEHLTLRRTDGTVLINDLNAIIERNTRVLVISNSGHAKIALFRASAGLCCDGEGRISRPDADKMLFLPERPYLPKGTLRELLVRSALNDSVPDEEVLKVLRRLNVEAVVEQAGGLHAEQDWNDKLGLSEQAALAIARALLAKPEFVFLDRLSIAMDSTQADQVLKLFCEQNISYLVLGKPDDSLGNFDAALQIASDGSWTWRTVTE
jgi:putative ATP-binding cassette transporter